MTKAELAAKAKEEFGVWMGGQEWSGWGTFTYAPTRPLDGAEQNPTVRSARRAFLWFLDRGLVRSAVWVTERGERFGRVHNHALIETFEPGADPIDRELIAREWNRVFGFAKLDPYDPARGAAGYVGKYLSKQDCDWDLWHSSNSSATKQSRSQSDWSTTPGSIPLWQSGTRRPTSYYCTRLGKALPQSRRATGNPPTSAIYFDGTKRVIPASSTNPPASRGTCRILIRDSREQ